MTHQENRARAADLRRQGVFLCTGGSRRGLTEADLDAVDAFRAFLAESPTRLTQDNVAAWPTLFESRAAFEAWRARWLPYVAGLADGPTNPEDWPAYREQILAQRPQLVPPPDPCCPYCGRSFTDAERGQQEFTPDHPARTLSGVKHGASCRGAGQPLRTEERP